jgi:tetratricopeptide (TPR) repeat protein
MGRIEKTVFISYRRTNFYTALAVYQDLTQHGYDVFFDYQSIDSGDFEKVIIENIKAKAHFLVILSPSALERCKEPGDWLRREIETAMDEKRNIIPLMMEGFDFGSPVVIQALSGKLATLNRFNGLRLYADYFFDAMEKLRNRFLKVEVEDAHLHSLSNETKEINETNKSAANEAAPVETHQLTAEEWFERGYVFQNDKNLDEAIRCYTEAIRLEPDFLEAYGNRGNAYSDIGNMDAAFADYNKVLEIDPNDAKAYYNLGNLLSDENLKRYEEAEAAYRKAIELNPSDATAYSNLGNLLSDENLKRYEEAMPLLEKMIEINPEDFNPYLAIVSINKQLGKSVSKDHLNKARQFMPEDDWYNQACLESVAGNIDKAFENLEKAAQAGKFNPDWAQQDPDLQWIRDDPRFKALVGE